MAKLIDDRCCASCRHAWDQPCPDLVRCLMEGPICHQDGSCRSKRRMAMAALRRESPSAPVVYVGAGACGLAAGADKTLAAARRWLDETDERSLAADLVRVGCIGLCAAEPIVDIQLPGRTRVCFHGITQDGIGELLGAVLVEGRLPAAKVLGQHRPADAQRAWADAPWLDEHPFFAPQRRRVLANCGLIDPDRIEEYIARGGYRAFAEAIQRQTPAELCEMVEASGLRDRGGGGPPTGSKWLLALNAPGDQKHLVCSADGCDPWAPADRAVIEGDPHRLLEGLAIAAYAVGATRACIYILAEHQLAARRLIGAVAQARTYGLVGCNILDSGVNLEVFVEQGEGAFACGEETSLIHGAEQKRGMPHPRPAFPAARGLFGKPTVISDVETLANLPGIVANGPGWFSSVGTTGSKGTKVLAVSGKVRRTGLVEVDMGTPLRRIIFDIAGGVPDGRQFKAVQVGGPSGGCLPAGDLDVEIDYESLKGAGAMMGSGGIVVMDDAACMVDVARSYVDFAQRQSCGKCTPCREGTRRMLEILQRITGSLGGGADLDAQRRPDALMHLGRLAEVIRDTSLCRLGQTAPNPVLCTLRHFRQEYEAHIAQRRCPAGACRLQADVG